MHVASVSKPRRREQGLCRRAASAASNHWPKRWRHYLKLKFANSPISRDCCDKSSAPSEAIHASNTSDTKRSALFQIFQFLLSLISARIVVAPELVICDSHE